MNLRRASRTFYRWPTPALGPYVERFWGWEATQPLELPLVGPGLGAEIFFHHGAPPRARSGGVETQLARAHLLCVRRVPVQLLAQPGLGFTVVRIRAGALGRFTRVPLAQLNDTQLGAAELWGPAGAELAERVARAQTMLERAALIEQFLLARLAEGTGDAVAERALSFIYRRPDESAIDDVAQSCGLSRRQLERRVSAHFGQAPVELRRTARFYRAARSLALEPEQSALQGALHAGYYDQSHFIREFRRFMGVTPQSFRVMSHCASHFYNPSRS